MTGYLLIFAVLVLGGVIATIGDRLGSRIGKARLSLFKLRPKDTAVLMTILTGGLISATTLGFMLAVSSQLRTGLFELDDLQAKLRQARDEVARAKQDATKAQQDVGRSLRQRDDARQRQQVAKKLLDATNASLLASQVQQRRTEIQLRQVAARSNALRAAIDQLQREQTQLIRQRDAVKAQIAQRDREIAQRDRSITDKNRAIAQQEAVIAQGRVKLRQLEAQQAAVDQELQRLERTLVAFRQGNVALTRGQVLASVLVQLKSPDQAQATIDQVLREANRIALLATRPGETQIKDQVIQIPQAEIERLKRQVQAGRPYVLRILSASNVLMGERQVLVFADSTPNQLVLPANQTLASTSFDDLMGEEAIRQRINLLLSASQNQARRSGSLSEVVEVGDGDVAKLVEFLRQVKETPGLLTVEAVTVEPIYTATPLRLQLVAMQNGKIKFRT
jgi:uncharacterized protein (DUF3084 family)